MGQKESKSEFNEALKYNNLTYNDYFLRLKLLARKMFKWENLPDGMTEKFIESVLQNIGMGVFFRDEKLGGFIFSKGSGSNYLNIYDEPTSYDVYSNMFHKTIKANDCVVIRNNDFELPLISTIDLFAHRLYEAERTIDVNIKAQKTPVMVFANDKNLLSLKNLYAQIDGNMPVTYVNEKIDLSQIKAFSTNAPFVADKLQDYKHQIYNEVLTFLGIQNANTDKAERLISDEVNANNQLIEMNADTLLSSRQEAVEKINKKYKLNIKVSLRYKNKSDIINKNDVDEESEENE